MFPTIDINAMLNSEEYELGTLYLHTRYSYHGKNLGQTYSDNAKANALYSASVYVTEHVSEPTTVTVTLPTDCAYEDRIAAAGKLRSFFYHAPIGVKGRKVKFIESIGQRFTYKLV